MIKLTQVTEKKYLKFSRNKKLQCAALKDGKVCNVDRKPYKAVSSLCYPWKYNRMQQKLVITAGVGTNRLINK